MHHFSRKGECPTADELAILARASANVNSVWVAIAQRIGAAALFVVLDEIGGEKMHVPTREHFVHGLWVPMQRDTILALRAAGVSAREVAAQLNVSRRHVCNVARTAHARDDSAHLRVPCSRA